MPLQNPLNKNHTSSRGEESSEASKCLTRTNQIYVFERIHKPVVIFMPRKLPRMTEKEIDQLISEQILCRIAFMGKKAPHIAPFQYALLDGKLYFHFTNYGKKMGLLQENNPVCVEIETYTQDLTEYKFVLLIGKIEVVTDQRERALALEKMVETAQMKGLSENFLAAHGFAGTEGWAILTPDKPLVIVKLQDIVEKTGLQSP